MAAKNDVNRLQCLIDMLKSTLADQVKSVTELKSKVETVDKKVTPGAETTWGIMGRKEVPAHLERMLEDPWLRVLWTCHIR